MAFETATSGWALRIDATCPSQCIPHGKWHAHSKLVAVPWQARGNPIASLWQSHSKLVAIRTRPALAWST